MGHIHFTKKNIMFSFSIIARRFKRQRVRLVADRRVNFFLSKASASGGRLQQLLQAAAIVNPRRGATRRVVRRYNIGHTPPLLQ
jgi:hypothetical protein